MLQNNNQSMQTVVETFIIEETSNLIHDNDALQKWNEKVEELKLQGQMTVATEAKSPIPYLWLNDALISTFETLCPTKVAIEKYCKSPIPIEILELVSMSKKEKHFDFVEIWYNEVEKDPVCIGYNVPEMYRHSEDWSKKYYAQKYLIGRWADVKASLDSLIEKAKAVFITNSISSLKQRIRDCERSIEDMEQNANTKFGGAMPNTEISFL